MYKRQSVLGLQQPLRHLSDVQSTRRRLQISDGGRNTHVRCTFCACRFILEIDLRYPESLHDLHNAYPLAPEHLKIDEDMLSPTLRDILSETGMRHTTSTKLVSNLKDKEKYVTHYRCLQFYLNLQIQIVQIKDVAVCRASLVTCTCCALSEGHLAAYRRTAGVCN